MYGWLLDLFSVLLAQKSLERRHTAYPTTYISRVNEGTCDKLRRYEICSQDVMSHKLENIMGINTKVWYYKVFIQFTFKMMSKFQYILLVAYR